VSERYQVTPTGLAACDRLTEINLPLLLYKYSSNIRDCSMLLSTVSSPHLHRITLNFGRVLPTFNSRVVPNLLCYNWGTLDDTLRGISLKSRNVLEVAVILSVEGHARSISESGFEAFLPRFREVGKVGLELLWVEP